jgi:TM2 domain-containing membrane protein YozV
MATQLKKCQNCGTENSGFESFCRSCGTMLSSSGQNQQVQQSANAGMQQQQIPGADKKLLAGLMGILFGGFGVHKFVLGYTTEGLIQIAITIVTCGIGSIVGLIEGIIYLTKSDQEFVDTYIRNKKGWF